MRQLRAQRRGTLALTTQRRRQLANLSLELREALVPGARGFTALGEAGLMLEKAKREFRALQDEIRTHQKTQTDTWVKEKLKQLQGFYADVKKYYEIAPAIQFAHPSADAAASFAAHAAQLGAM